MTSFFCRQDINTVLVANRHTIIGIELKKEQPIDTSLYFSFDDRRSHF